MVESIHSHINKDFLKQVVKMYKVSDKCSLTTLSHESSIHNVGDNQVGFICNFNKSGCDFRHAPSSGRGLSFTRSCVFFYSAKPCTLFLM